MKCAKCGEDLDGGDNRYSHCDKPVTDVDPGGSSGGPDRLIFVLLGLLAIAIVLVLALTHRLIDSDRTSLLDEFAEQQREHVETVAREIGDNIDDILHDLQFASPLLASAGSTAEQRRILEVMVKSEPGYGAAVLVGDFEPVWAHDSSHQQLSSTLSERMLSTTRELFDEHHAAPLETSGAVVDDENHSLRIFALRFETSDGQRGALGLLVDIETFLEPLRLVSSDPQSHLLVVGPRGVPSPASDPTLAKAFRADGHGGLARLTQQIDAQRSGTLRISGRDPSLEPLGSPEFVAAFASIPARGGLEWSVVTLASLSQLQTLERQVTLRLYTVAFVIVVMLGAFAMYVLMSIRRRAVLNERLKSAWKIAHLSEKSEKILERIPAGVLVLAADGTITDVNHAIGERSEDEFVGRALEQVFPTGSEAIRDEIVELFELALRTEVAQRTLEEGIELFGGQRHYNVYAIPLETGSSDAAALLVFEDITALRDLENQLLYAEKLATVGELAAGLAHEVGTPLGVARGRAEYLTEKLDGTDSRRKHVRIIIDQIDRVRATIESFLDFSRSGVAATGAVHLRDAVVEVEELLQFDLEKYALTLQIDVPEDLPALRANADQLRQVLTNLVINARDASERGGTVSISARASDAHVTIEVEDQGDGISDEHQRRVFDPFFTTKKRGKGTGLGLWVVMQIVRSHDARIDLESEPGSGTCIRIAWPVAGTHTSSPHPRE